MTPATAVVLLRRRPGRRRSRRVPATLTPVRRVPAPAGGPVRAVVVPYAGVGAADVPHPSQLPVPDARAPRVLVLDLPGALTLRLVGTRWRVLPAATTRPPVEGVVAELVVAPVADVPGLRALQARCPGAAVLAVLPADAGSGLVVALLDAGAAACVRGSSADDVAAHLAALTRRLRARA